MDGAGKGIFARRYNAAGVALGSEFQVNTYTTNSQRDPSVAMDAAGDFVVTWDGKGQDLAGDGVYGQRYNASGVAQGTEFQVNTFTTDSQVNSSVAMDSAGDFVVTWASFGQDGSGYGVYGQRYNAAGTAQGSEFRVNTRTTDYQRETSVAMDAAGDFVVTWTSDNQDGVGKGVYAQRYNSAGAAVDSEFLVNTYTGTHQKFSAVAMDAAGDFVIAWESQAQDGDQYGVYAQRYVLGHRPTNTTLSPASIPENRPSGTTVGTFTTADPDSNESFTHALVSGTGSTDNSSFTITGSTLKTAASFNYEAKSSYSIRVQVTDKRGLTFQKVLTVAVTDVNDAPVKTAGTVAPLTVLEDAPLTSLGLTGVTYGPGGASNEASQTLTYTVTGLPTAKGTVYLLDGTTVVANNTAYTLAQLQGMKFKPTANANGSATFAFAVKDSGGTANGGVDTLNQSIAITVTSVNDVPVKTAGAVATLTVLEDAALTSLGLTGLTYGPGGAGTEASQTLTYTVTTVPVALGNIFLTDGTTVVTNNTAYTLAQLQGMKFKPTANANGSGTFAFAVKDSGGTANGGVDTLNQSSAIIVTAVNDVPVKTAGAVATLTVLEDAALTSLGLTGLTYGPGGAGYEGSQTLTYTVTTVPVALGTIFLTDGTTVVTNNTAYTLAQLQGMKFKPAANANGSAAFAFAVKDSGGTANGGVDTLNQSSAIIVTAVNDAPVKTAGTVAPLTVLEDAALTSLGLTGLTYGPGGGGYEGSQTLTYTVTALPAALGTIFLTDGTTVVTNNTAYTLAQLQGMKFKPAANANGSATFAFAVKDSGGTANGGVDTLNQFSAINVTAVNDAPTGTSKTLSMPKSTTYTFAVADFGFADPNDTPANVLLAVKIATAPASGSLTNNGVTVTAGTFVLATDIAAGKLKFTPVANVTGSPYASFNFQVRDDGGTANGGLDLDPTQRVMTINVV